MGNGPGINGEKNEELLLQLLMHVFTGMMVTGYMFPGFYFNLDGFQLHFYLIRVRIDLSAGRKKLGQFREFIQQVLFP